MQPEPSQKERSVDVLKLILPLYVPAFLFSFSHGLLVPILPLFAQSFNISYALIGLILASEAIGMLIGDLPAGMLMGRMGQRTSMIIGLSLVGLSTTFLFFTNQIIMVIILRMIAGLGVSLYSVSRHYFLVEMAPPNTRGRLLSLFGGVFRMGRLLGPIVGGLIAAAFGIHYSFLMFGFSTSISLVVSIFFLPHFEIPYRGLTSLSAITLYQRMFKQKWQDLRSAGVGYLFMQIVRGGPTVLIPLFAANYLHMSVETIGLIMSLSSTLDMILFYPAGIVMDRWGRKLAIMLSNLFLSLGVALIPLSTSFASLLLAGMVAGLGSGLGSGSMLTLGSDLAPKEGKSEFIGAWTLIGDIGNTSGPLLIGSIADLFSLPITSIAIVSGGLIALLIFGRFVPETLQVKTTQVSSRPFV